MLITDASHLPRIMKCNGSLLLQADPSLTSRDNTTRSEGNAAHWLASVVFTGEHTAVEMIDRKAPNGIYVTAEMAEHVTDYLSEIDRTARNIPRHMEWSYQLNGQNWQINGRADYIDLDEDTLNIDDFKYGFTIVEPERNWTLIAHAIGYCVEHDVAPAHINFYIHQPRAPHRDGKTRSRSITYPELIALYHEMSATLNNPSNITQTGPHCYRCPSFLSCAARQDADLSAIEVSCNAYNAHINNADLAARLDMIARAKKMLDQAEKSYIELGVHRAQKGEIIENYHLETELTNRVWKDGVTPELLKVLTGKELAKPKTELITPKQAESLIGADLVALYAERRSKGKKLVRIDANKKASKMFGAK